MSKSYNFPCGCNVPIDDLLPYIHNHPSLIYPTEVIQLPQACPLVWEMLGEGHTKMVFQLESPLGRQWTKKLKPGIPNPEEGIEQLAAMGALLRPGCIGQNTKIGIKQGYRPGRKIGIKWITIAQLYTKFKRFHNLYENDIISLDEETRLLFSNTIEDVIYSGRKEVWKPIFQSRGSKGKFYNLECTLDHKLLTLDNGWQELKDIRVGQIIAVIKLRGKKLRPVKWIEGQKSFKDICSLHYIYKCVFCDWSDGSLDVNHIRGNRKSDNSPENLCFLCPNHHRMYSEGTITESEVLEVRKACELPNTYHIEWRVYKGKEFIGEQDTYDISVKGPNHNFIAGNVVVHNCLKAKDEDGISMTERYCRRKNGEEPVSYYHPSLEPILNATFGVLTYQEQAMAIAVALAGFTPMEADDLRKAIGKKKADVMAKVKAMFIEKAGKLGIVTPEQAAEIFGWIEKSQRYSFNKSHAVSYGLIGYHTAHLKAHFPLQCYTSFLYYAKEKQDPLLEIRQLVNDAKVMGIEVVPPRFEDLKTHFNTDGVVITFGISDIKGIGQNHVHKMRKNAAIVEKEVGIPRMEWSWFDFLTYFSPTCPSNVVKRLIDVGAMRNYSKDRQRMHMEYEAYNQLTEKEQHTISCLRAGDYYRDGYLLAEPTEITNVATAIEVLLEQPKGVANKNRREKVMSLWKMLKNPPRNMMDSPAWIAKTEEECLGIPITYTRADGADRVNVNTTCKEFRDGKDINSMVMAVDIQECREIRIQNGDNRGKVMAFLVICDGSGSLEDVCVFSDCWEKYGNIIYNGNTVELRGRRDPKRKSFIVEEVYKA